MTASAIEPAKNRKTEPELIRMMWSGYALIFHFTGMVWLSIFRAENRKNENRTEAWTYKYIRQSDNHVFFFPFLAWQENSDFQ